MGKSKPIYISRGILLNFSPHYIALPHPYRNGLTVYPTNEHYFQARKTLAMDISIKERRRAHTQIQHAETASTAKRMGSELAIDLKRWDRMKYNIMLAGVLAKFSQHAKAREALLATDPRPLVERRPDPVWGDNMDGSGENWMGEILMLVRGVLL